MFSIPSGVRTLEEQVAEAFLSTVTQLCESPTLSPNASATSSFSSFSLAPPLELSSSLPSLALLRSSNPQRSKASSAEESKEEEKTGEEADNKSSEDNRESEQLRGIPPEGTASRREQAVKRGEEEKITNEEDVMMKERDFGTSMECDLEDDEREDVRLCKRRELSQEEEEDDDLVGNNQPLPDALSSTIAQRASLYLSGRLELEEIQEEENEREALGMNDDLGSLLLQSEERKISPPPAHHDVCRDERRRRQKGEEGEREREDSEGLVTVTAATTKDDLPFSSLSVKRRESSRREVYTIDRTHFFTWESFLEMWRKKKRREESRRGSLALAAGISDVVRREGEEENKPICKSSSFPWFSSSFFSSFSLELKLRESKLRTTPHTTCTIIERISSV